VSQIVEHNGAPRITYDIGELLRTSPGHELQGFRPLGWQPYPQHRGRRLSAPAARDTSPEGFTEIVQAAEGLHAVITDWPAGASQSATWVETVPAGYGYLYVGLEGDGRIEVEGIGYARRPGAASSITVAPPASTHTWRSGPRIARRGVCIAFHTRYLRSRYPDLPEQCTDTLGAWLTNSEARLRDFEVPLLPVMRAATAALLATRLEGQFRHTFVSSTVEQLLCLAMAALARRPVSSCRLSLRDRGIIHAVRRVLDEHVAEPVNVEALARRFGINRNKLRFGFRELMGTSIAEYLQELRMRLAFTLLEQGGHSVSEVAARVGYTHVCNFTTAFRRRFGHTPSRIAGHA
jgi:AraC-like DNA-binding protein